MSPNDDVSRAEWDALLKAADKQTKLIPSTKWPTITSIDESLKWMEHEWVYRSYNWHKKALLFARVALGQRAKYVSVRTMAVHHELHPTNEPMPVGAVVVWETGQWWMCGVHIGGDQVFCTDYPQPGKIGKPMIDNITKLWGMTLRGWVILEGTEAMVKKYAKAHPVG